MTEAQGWRAAIQLMAGIAAFLAVPMLALAARWLEAEARPDAANAARPRRRWRELLALPRFPLLALAFALIALIPGMMLAHLFPLMAALGVPTGTAVFAASLIRPGQVAGRVAVTLAAPKARAAAITIGAMLALVAATGLMAASGWVPWLVFLAVLAYGVGNGLVGIFRPVLARERYGGADIGAIAGALAGPALFLGAVAPVLGALIAAWAGYGLMLGVAGAAGLAAVGLLILTEPGDAAARGPRRGLALDRRRLRRAGNRDPARLQRLGHFAQQIDMQHAVFMARAVHADMVGQLEPLFKGAAGDAAMEIARLARLLGALRGDDKLGLALFDRQVGLGKPGHGDRDTIGIIAGFLNVVRGVGARPDILGHDPVQ